MMPVAVNNLLRFCVVGCFQSSICCQKENEEKFGQKGSQKEKARGVPSVKEN